MGLFRRDEPANRRAEDLIHGLCRGSGRWLLIRQEGDRYWVQANDHRPVKEIMVRQHASMASVLFQGWFPVRFSLKDKPDGLFGRLLVRNISLHYAGWSMVIGESCEACLSVSAQAPRRALDIALFDAVCREIRDELLNFHAELHNKFLYDAPSPMHKVPECEPDEIRYMESEASTLPPAEVAWRRIADQNGSVRYRLPKPGE